MQDTLIEKARYYERRKYETGSIIYIYICIIRKREKKMYMKTYWLYTNARASLSLSLSLSLSFCSPRHSFRISLVGVKYTSYLFTNTSIQQTVHNYINNTQVYKQYTSIDTVHRYSTVTCRVVYLIVARNI